MKACELWTVNYLLNALWQVPLVFAAALLAAKLARGPRLQHRIWLGALLLETTLPAASLRPGVFRQVLAQLLAGRFRPPAAGGDVQSSVRAAAASPAAALHLPDWLVVTLFAVYASTLLYLAGRLAWRLWKTHRLPLNAVPLSLTGQAAESWRSLERIFALSTGASAPRLALSPLVSGPVTLGVWRPVVLLPLDFLDRVSGPDLEAMLAHEFAHLERRDFGCNLLHEVLALALFFHPLLWRTRARLAETREMICDARAAQVLHGSVDYARSLLRMAALLAGRSPATTPHAIGFLDANSFERRLMHLTHGHSETRGLRRFAVGALCVVLALGTCGAALAMRLEVAAARPQNEASTPPNVSAGDFQAFSKVMPVYPAEAKAKGSTLDGSVVLAVRVNKEGLVDHVAVLQSLRADYDRSALEAVAQWRWKPFLLNGAPTEVDTTVTVTYSIAR